MTSAEKNANRFTGFAEVYDNARPALPQHFIELVRLYLGHEIGNVADLGCGTGLSTAAWKGHCKSVTGVEPSDDMLAIARSKECSGVSFIKGYSHNTGLPDCSMDAVVCSQSFHWMEPVSTLKEADRLLVSGRVFATVDCDWPQAAVGSARYQQHIQALGEIRTSCQHSQQQSIPVCSRAGIRKP